MSNKNELKLTEIANQYTNTLSKDIIKHVTDLAKASEWGVGLEELCNMIYEYEIPLKKSQFQEIKEFADAITLDESLYKILRELII